MKQITHGKYDDKDLDREFRDIITAIKELQTGSALTPVAVPSLEPSTSTSSTTTQIQRSGTVAVTGGTDNVITFATAMPTNLYTLPQPRCWTTSGGNYMDVGFVISAKTQYGFTINPVLDATCEYLATY